ncbi:MAG: metallophosphoesterase [Paracoccaceae bacterium]
MQASRLRVKDLGTLDGEVLLFGGAASNLQASQALLRLADRLEIPPARRICTGDIVAYCGSPAETVRLLHRQCELVAGNCEKQLVAGAPQCGCGFVRGSACDLLSHGWYSFARDALGADELVILAAAPDVIVFNVFGRRYAVIHGGLSDISRYLWPCSPSAEFEHEVAALPDLLGPVDGVVAGHCGLAFEREVAGVRWINAGAIGMPPHDGRAMTRYVVLGRDGARIGRLSYDVAGAVAAMQSAGLVQGYERTLVSGFWPSQEVLPAAMRR